MKGVLGIDPGLSGALAIIYPDRDLEVYDVPTIEGDKGGKVRRHPNWSELARWVDARASAIEHAFIERVSAFPGQGVSSAFRFGMIFGGLVGVVGANFLPMTLVPPAVWKKHHRLASGSEKDASRLRASELFPHSSGLFARVKDADRAEACLIASYGLHTLRGSNASQSNPPADARL